MPERKISLALSMGSAGLYAGVAVAMGFANKATLQVFGLANTLLLLQMCAVIVVVGALRVRASARLLLSCNRNDQEVNMHLMLVPFEAFAWSNGGFSLHTYIPVPQMLLSHDWLYSFHTASCPG